MNIPINLIQIREGRREVDASHVQELAGSIRELGLLNPITIDQENTLIAGLHRLEAVKMLGWTEIECSISSLEGLQAELAEIDENIVRSDLSVLEYGEMLLRRKEIYEQLHPEARHGGDRKSEAIKAKKIRFDSAKSFVQDTAKKLNVVPRTVELQIQTAKNLHPETKKIIRDSNTKITKKAALELSRLDPGQQKEAATRIASGEIHSLNEYKANVRTPADKQQNKVNAKINASQPINPLPTDINAGMTEQTPGKQEEKRCINRSENNTEPQKTETSHIPYHLEKKSFATFKESIADLKNPDKDCSCTPDNFLAELDAFVRKFHREIEWYSHPDYEAVYALFTEQQRMYLRQQIDSICQAAEHLYQQIEERNITP